MTDASGATGTAQKTLTINDGSLTVIAEAGSVTVSQADASTWHAVAFQHAFTDPIVVMGPASSGDPEPLTLRVRNVTGSGFEFQLDEWDYLDGAHGTETVPYVVAERGVHTLADGRLLEAGTTSAKGNISTASFSAPFAAPPVLVGQVVSPSNPKALAVRLRNVSASSFQVRLMAQEREGKAGPETLAYVAFALGVTDGKLDVARTTDRVTDVFSGITYTAPFAAPPVVIAAMQTLNGSDPSTLRSRLTSAAGLQMRVEEEQSQDAETTHGTEVVGYVALPAGLLYALPPASAFASGAESKAEALPLEFALEPNRPNPFRARTTFRYALADEVPVRLSVYDALGRLVAHVVDERQAAGWHEATFDAGRLASGVYVYRLEAGPYARAMRMLVVR